MARRTPTARTRPVDSRLINGMSVGGRPMKMEKASVSSGSRAFVGITIFAESKLLGR